MTDMFAVLRTISIRWLGAPESCCRKARPQNLGDLVTSLGGIKLQLSPASQSKFTRYITPANPYHNIPPAEQGPAGASRAQRPAAGKQICFHPHDSCHTTAWKSNNWTKHLAVVSNLRLIFWECMRGLIIWCPDGSIYSQDHIALWWWWRWKADSGAFNVTWWMSREPIT